MYEELDTQVRVVIMTEYHSLKLPMFLYFRYFRMEPLPGRK